MEKLVERLLTYVKINTRSDVNSQTTSTTAGQVVSVRMTETELYESGLADMRYNEQNGFLAARLPGNQSVAKSVGLIVHLDTVDFLVENIRSQVITDYDSQDVLLNQGQGTVLSVAEFPNLKECQGETLITTSRATLLGADDKTGIVEILAVAEYFLVHLEVTRGDVRLAFDPNEGTRRRTDQFDAPDLPVAFAYTIDNGRVGHFEYGTFNAAQAAIVTKGASVHPRTVYGSLVDAIKLGEQLDQLLPQKEVPRQTRGNRGFCLFNKFTGSIEKAELAYIIRDHDRENFQVRKQFLEKQVQHLNTLTGKSRLAIIF